MAVQSTARISTNQTGADGTLIRDVREKIFFIKRQLYPLGALAGGSAQKIKGLDIPARPALIRRRQAKSYNVEFFTNEQPKKEATVTTGTTAAGTSIVTDDSSAEFYVNSICQVQNTEDFFIVTANSAGTMTIARMTTGAQVISSGMKILQLGQMPSGELFTNPPSVLRSDDKHYNYHVQLVKTWMTSRREMNMERYGGKTQDRDKEMKLHEILSEEERVIACSRRESSMGSVGTTPRGFEGYALDGSGLHFPFGGTITKAKLRELGESASEYIKSGIAVGFTSTQAIGMMSSVLDSSIRVTPSEIAKEFKLPNATRMEIGPLKVEWVPLETYSYSVKKTQGVIFDPALCSIDYLNELELSEVKPFADSAQSSTGYGQWYLDGCCLIIVDGGKSVTFFDGVNQYAS